MGQKQSSHKRLKSIQSLKQEFTEVVDLEFSDVSEPKIDQKEAGILPASTVSQPEHIPDNQLDILPRELVVILNHLDDLEKDISTMTDSQIDLYFATLKDDLHNNWQKVYSIKDDSHSEIKSKKIEVIDKVKFMLKQLNERFLKRKRYDEEDME